MPSARRNTIPVEAPLGSEPGRGQPTLMLFSGVDARSGGGYQEYRCVYGEDVEAALRLLFKALAPKPDPEFPFPGRPALLYLDGGPIATSRVFQNVRQHLGIAWPTPLPAGQDGRRVTARAQGKVERPLRTVKEAPETLYHFHKPQNEAEANLWLQRYRLSYNRQPHRHEPPSRLDDWLANLPTEGLREMGTGERFCTFAREPERRKVGSDARIAVDGTVYEVEPGLAGESVVLWGGLFDTELYVAYQSERCGPYQPVDGPIPLPRYRTFKKTQAAERADRIEQRAPQLGLPRAALTGEPDLQLAPSGSAVERRQQPFESVQNDGYPTVITAQLAIADELAKPLATRPLEDRQFIDPVLPETLARPLVLSRVRDYFRTKTQSNRGEPDPAG